MKKVLLLLNLILLSVSCRTHSTTPPHITSVSPPSIAYEVVDEYQQTFPEKQICEDYGDLFFIYSGAIFKGGINETLEVLHQDGTVRILVAENVYDTFDWSSKGDKLVTVCGEDIFNKRICIFSFNEEEGCLSFQVIAQYNLPEPCLEDDILIEHSEPIEIGFNAFSWSPDEEQFAFVCGNSRVKPRVCIMDLDKQVMCQHWDRGILYVDWSPVTNELVIGDIKREIYVVNKTGDEIRYLARGQSPEWSPDGKNIVFIKESRTSLGEYNGMGIAMIDASGSNEHWIFKPFEFEEHERLKHDYGLDWMGFLCNDGGNECELTWSPDQNYLVFSSNVGNIFSVQLVSIDIANGDVHIYSEEVCSPTCSSPSWRP